MLEFSLPVVVERLRVKSRPSGEESAFLRSHATGGGKVPVSWNGPISGFERLDLLVFNGWH